MVKNYVKTVFIVWF